MDLISLMEADMCYDAITFNKNGSVMTVYFDIHLSAAYNAIIAAACVPTPTPANYCLLLNFE